MAIKPVKTELFRFVSQRPVQLIDQEKKALFFVQHPKNSKSHFLKDLDQEKIAMARKQVRDKANSFNALSTARALPTQYDQLLKFSLWLSKNKRQLPAQRLIEYATEFSVLSENDEIFIWDQFFYQLVNPTNPSLRQACSNVLIANHFLNTTKNKPLESLAKSLYEGNPNLTIPDDFKRKLIKRLANAKILVHKAFSVNKNIQTKEEIQRPVPPDKILNENKLNDKPISSDYLVLGNKNARSLSRYRDLANAKDDLKKNFAIPGARNMSIDEMLKNPEVKLNTKTRAHLERQSNGSVHIYSHYKTVNQDMIVENRAYRDSTNELLDTPNDAIDDYCYLIHLEYTTKTDSLTMSIKVAKRSVNVSSAAISVYKGSKEIASSNNIELLESDSLIKTYNLLPGQPFNIDESTTYNIKGTITLNDGHTIKIDITISAKDNTYFSCDSKSDEEDKETEDNSPELYGVNRIGMGIFRRVEQEVCCYVPGEVSHIENIMAREYKERSTRNFTSTEDTIETSSDFEVETNTDTSTTVRNEIQKAVSEVISKSNQLNAGISTGVTGKSPYGDFTAEANLGFAMTNAAANSDMEATTYAQDITSAAAERVLQKASEKRTSKVIKEFEEKIRHGYDNRDGDQHVTGIYRWIDIIYTNRLVNYGNMEMVEFLIPEPSKFYKDTILGINANKKPGNTPGGSNTENKLKSLSELGIKSPEDIKAYHHENINTQAGNSVGNYFQDLANYYGVIPSPGPMDSEKKQNISLTAAGLDHKKEHSKTNADRIEDGYELATMKFSGHFIHNPGNDNNPSIFSLSAAGKQWDVRLSYKNINKDKYTFNIPAVTQADHDLLKDAYAEVGAGAILSPPAVTIFDFDSHLTGMVNANLTAHRAISYDVNVELTLHIAPEVLLDWKTDFFAKLTDAYEAHVESEAAASAEEEKKKEEELAKLATGNTALNRRVEIRELKRAAIEMITRPFGIFIGKSFLDTGKCKVNFPRQDAKWETYSSHVKFFEQAFEWEIMAYLFYPYFWADRCDWRKLLKTEDPIDQIFEGFLQSGMARMVVPVRRGFENAVNYYFETGEIWNGGDLVLDTDDELYLSIDEELEEPESFIEDEWQTRVPTTLTLIQGDSAFLQGEGLPCCDKVTTGETTGIEGSKSLLGVLKES